MALIVLLAIWSACAAVPLIFSTDTGEQFFALEALGNYFSWKDTTLNKELIKKLDHIVATTKIRFNASNALDVQLQAGIIEQIEAVIAMDDWKGRNRDNW